VDDSADQTPIAIVERSSDRCAEEAEDGRAP